MPAETYVTYNVTSETIGDSPIWRLWQTRPDGLDHHHVMPQGIVELRAAEYGIDPTTEAGKALVWDILLHEPHMPEVDRAVQHRAALGKIAPGDEVYLWNAKSQADALSALQTKLVHTKQNIRQITWKGVSLSQVHPLLRGLMDTPLDLARMKLHATMVTDTRIRVGAEPGTPSQPVLNNRVAFVDDSVSRRHRELTAKS